MRFKMEANKPHVFEFSEVETATFKEIARTGIDVKAILDGAVNDCDDEARTIATSELVDLDRSKCCYIFTPLEDVELSDADAPFSDYLDTLFSELAGVLVGINRLHSGLHITMIERKDFIMALVGYFRLSCTVEGREMLETAKTLGVAALLRQVEVGREAAEYGN